MRVAWGFTIGLLVVVVMGLPPPPAYVDAASGFPFGGT
jgi:hypothetical protein